MKMVDFLQQPVIGPLLAVAVVCLPAAALASGPPAVVPLTAQEGSEADNFGASVALANGTALVGAPLADVFAYNAGAAYIFDFDAAGESWAQTAIIGGKQLADFAFFARAVGLSGNVAAVGAPQSPTRGPNDNAGAVYVFERGVGRHSGWGQTEQLSASDGAFGDEFGRSLAIAGLNIAVGAQSHGAGSVRTGAVYLFEYDPQNESWSQTQQLLPPDLVDQAFFGAALAIEDGVLVVGAPGEYFSPEYPGAAYVYNRATPPLSGWNLRAQLVGSDCAPGDRLGGAVAIHGDLIAASSLENDGTVYVFEHSPDDGGWQQTAKLTPEPPSAAAGFGASVAIDGNRIIVGAPFEGTDGAGGAYVFSRGGLSGHAWNQIAHIAADNTEGARVGSAVAAIGGRTLLGAPLAAGAGAAHGAAYIADTPIDTDGDGVRDLEDNCLASGNGPAIPDAGGHSQRDTDADTVGNVCDADFNGDCATDFHDLAILRETFFMSGNLNEDIDGDGFVNFVDLAAMKALFFLPPGPSGLPGPCNNLLRLPGS